MDKAAMLEREAPLSFHLILIFEEITSVPTRFYSLRIYRVVC
ncbi:hypothetical protein FHS15_001463 [Paenibacillus castaneae]|nr:hypothetical protein [Paenibacillus castaneae]